MRALFPCRKTRWKKQIHVWLQWITSSYHAWTNISVLLLCICALSVHGAQFSLTWSAASTRPVLLMRLLVVWLLNVPQLLVCNNNNDSTFLSKSTQSYLSKSNHQNNTPGTRKASETWCIFVGRCSRGCFWRDGGGLVLCGGDALSYYEIHLIQQPCCESSLNKAHDLERCWCNFMIILEDVVWLFLIFRPLPCSKFFIRRVLNFSLLNLAVNGLEFTTPSRQKSCSYTDVLWAGGVTASDLQV